MFHKRQPLEKLYKQKKLIIVSSIPELRFSPNIQIGENSVDLRLHPQVKKLKDTVDKIDFLVPDNLDESYFEEIILTNEGYVLFPGKTLFCQTLEMINVISPQHIGIVVGRTKISAYGISVNLNQVKVPSGLLWNFPLHIVNNTEKPICIYPFINIAQLLIFPYAYGKRYKKDGDYQKIDFLDHLGIREEERDVVGESLREWQSLITNYQFQEKKENIVNDIKNEEKLSKWRRYLFNSCFWYDLLRNTAFFAVLGSYFQTELGLFFTIKIIIISGLILSVIKALNNMKRKL
ncbi:MAG: hypothetical protein FWD26_02825 [Treponema sp.]|nr:hypothetical protein [Treponema sp.]